MRTFKLKHGNSEAIVDQIRKHTVKLDTAADLDPLMERIGDSQYVLLGEASHGTHDYYTWRTHITKRLIAEKNFSFVAVEGDWPDCYKLNRYIKGYPGSGADAKTVLQSFDRWPTWMWANWEVVALAEWMHKHNKLLPSNKKVGFYGLDVYSLWESMDAIMNYLEKTDPMALKTAKKALNCFAPYIGQEGSMYGYASYMIDSSCEREVVDLLSEIIRKLPMYNTDHETVFSTEQNAFVAVNAERYYRTMIKDGAGSWNIRDNHMFDTLNRLVEFYGANSKVIVWEHNSHIGDARATDMRKDGFINVGQLVKEQHENKGVVRIGFGSYEGTVVAGRQWGGKMEKMKIPPAKKGSLEYLLHEIGSPNQLLLTENLKNIAAFSKPIDHRAIGVVYDPVHEKDGTYVPSYMTQRYEAFIFIDRSEALHPLHIKPDGQQIPETYPFGV